MGVMGLMGIVGLWSCDDKLCYCYENGHEQMVYVNSDVACNSMTHGERGCVESYERMNPGDVAKHNAR